MKFYVTLQQWHFSFHQFCGVPAVKLLWPSKPNALGFTPPNGQTPRLGTWLGTPNSHSCGRTSVIKWFSVVGHPLCGYVIWLWQMEPSYHVVLASFFVFDSRLSFLVGSSLHLFLMVVQQIVVILVFWWGWAQVLVRGSLWGFCLTADSSVFLPSSQRGANVDLCAEQRGCRKDNAKLPGGMCLKR